MLIKDEGVRWRVLQSMDKIIPGGDIFRSRQNLQNEIGILKSFGLNHKVMYELEDFHIVYTAVGQARHRREPHVQKLTLRGGVGHHQRFSPGKRVDIKILSPEKYLMTIEADDYEGEHSFGERFNRFGFDFIIYPSEQGGVTLR